MLVTQNKEWRMISLLFAVKIVSPEGDHLEQFVELVSTIIIVTPSFAMLQEFSLTARNWKLALRDYGANFLIR